MKTITSFEFDEADICNAIIQWAASQRKGEGPILSANSIVFKTLGSGEIYAIAKPKHEEAT